MSSAGFIMKFFWMFSESVVEARSRRSLLSRCDNAEVEKAMAESESVFRFFLLIFLGSGMAESECVLWGNRPSFSSGSNIRLITETREWFLENQHLSLISSSRT